MRSAYFIASLVSVAVLHVYVWNRSLAQRYHETPIPDTEEPSRDVTKLADISDSMEGKRTTVTGVVSDLWEPAGGRAPRTIILRDESGVLEIVHWLNAPPTIKVGDWIECAGTVSLYRGALQLRLWSRGDLRILAP